MGQIHDLVARLGKEAAKAQLVDPADVRRVEWAADILSVEQLHRNWLHSGFCMVSLPHSKPKEDNRPYSVKNGDYKLILSPKPIDTDDEGNPLYAGLPFGAKARLIMVYMQTYAVRHKTRVIHLGESMTAWIRKLGFGNVSGGERGVITAVNEQARRIARCEFTMIYEEGRRRLLRDQPLVKGLELFAEADDDAIESETSQLTLFSQADMPSAISTVKRRRKYNWVKEVEISEDFYNHLCDNRVVLAEEAIAKLKGSSWALDVYLWLSYRLRTVKTGENITWEQLRQQFSPRQYKNNAYVFRQKVMEPAIRDVLAVYPEANLELSERGIKLLPSILPVPNKQHVVMLPG